MLLQFRVKLFYGCRSGIERRNSLFDPSKIIFIGWFLANIIYIASKSTLVGINTYISVLLGSSLRRAPVSFFCLLGSQHLTVMTGINLSCGKRRLGGPEAQSVLCHGPRRRKHPGPMRGMFIKPLRDLLSLGRGPLAGQGVTFFFFYPSITQAAG